MNYLCTGILLENFVISGVKSSCVEIKTKNMTSLKLAKTALRKEMKELILKLTDEEKCRQSISVTKQLLQDDWYINAKSISIYLHMEDEIKTQDILEDALR